MTSKLKPIRTKHDARTPGVTYQLEHVLCGKAKCKKLHGPYWYAYWRESAYSAKGRMRTRYVGKKFHTIDRNAEPAGKTPKTASTPAPASSSSKPPKKQRPSSSKLHKVEKRGVFYIKPDLSTARVSVIAGRMGVSPHWLYQRKTGRLEFVPPLEQGDPK